MLLNSFTFLGFFAATAAVYYALPQRRRWVLLLLASYWFYSSFEPLYLLLLAYATLVAWGAGLAVSRRKAPGGTRGLLAVGVLAELLVLALFKYADFFMGSVEGVLAPITQATEPLTLPRLGWLLPAGLSFFTFSCISYIVDCHRGKLPAERHIGHLAVYVAFFPKLIAGPIERAPHFLPQLRRGAVFHAATATFGLQLLLWGLFKKVVIADRLAEFADAGFANAAFQSPVTVLVAAYCYAFQIYCDFSGYSDMAIGMAAILGFRLSENFRRPYLSRNIAEFWSARWHISLASWFRDYLYIPLGGNRVSRPRMLLNMMIVFAVSGLWHGANWTFVIWGALNGAYQVLWYLARGALGRAAQWVPAALWTLLSVLLTFHLVMIAWVFFRAETLSGAMAVLGRIWGALPQYPTLLTSYNWSPSLLLALGLVVLLIVVECLDELRSVFQRIGALPLPTRWTVYYLLLAGLVIIGRWSGSEFVYMQF